MSYHDDIDAIASWENDHLGSRFASSGPRRDEPAVCYTCGEPVPDGPRFGREAACDDCARAGRGPVVPWLVGVETR